MSDDLDCDPARKCQSCCCIVVVTILVIFTLSLAKMYIGHDVHDVHDEQNELTGIIFLVMLLFFFCLLLFFVRFSVLLFKKRVRDSAPRVPASCGDSGARQSETEPAPTAAPPPYHEALLLPAPLAESPPPAYDKL
ncbi:uncharacterized protein LOC119091067 [Pollicipes pollicipes]|nr:uncharacterized protein LOC119091067 [Pollicipes pollicipes]